MYAPHPASHQGTPYGTPPGAEAYTTFIAAPQQQQQQQQQALGPAPGQGQDGNVDIWHTVPSGYECVLFPLYSGAGAAHVVGDWLIGGFEQARGLGYVHLQRVWARAFASALGTSARVDSGGWIDGPGARALSLPSLCFARYPARYPSFSFAFAFSFFCTVPHNTVAFGISSFVSSFLFLFFFLL
jgi:hypothetical protein